jgi:hypothetical protein
MCIQPVLNWQYFFSTDTLGLNWTNYAVDTREWASLPALYPTPQSQMW